MKTIFIYFALFTAAIVLWACPYKSDVGIDNGPTIKIDKALIGTWHKKAYPYDSTELVFTKNTAEKYALKATLSDGESGYDGYNYDAWFSTISKMQLLTLYDRDSKKYSFGEVELQDNKLTIKLLSEDISTRQYATVAELREFIETIYSVNKVVYDTDSGLNDLLKTK